MNRQYNASGRLIKVILPPRLVEAMDEAISRSDAYASRVEFVRDAIEGHIAELRLLRPPGQVETDARPDHLHLDRDDIMVAIPSPPDGVPTLHGDTVPAAEPTWGMHNRDYPTLWGLWNLVDRVSRAGRPIPFSEWITETTSKAWAFSQRLPGAHFDTAGFPSNPQKREASEGRFLKFFLATDLGTGPLFSLGLAGVAADCVAPTPTGVNLLANVAGLTCERGVLPSERAASSFLDYLAEHVPSDFAFLIELLGLISGAASDRLGLVSAVAHEHPNWTQSVVETNVAGFVGRSREWGLLEQKQDEGQYRLTRFGGAWLARVYLNKKAGE